jgi:hypothetical protein
MTRLTRTLIGTVFLLFATNSQAVIVETLADCEKGDILTATADATTAPTTRVVHFNNLTTKSDNTYTISDAGKVLIPTVAFVHDYVLESVVDTVVALSLVTENGLADLITGLALTISGTGGFTTIMDNTIPLGLGFAMTAGESYTISLAGTATGVGSDYRLEVSAVPVPAAVWLFGTALLGLFGVQRNKAKGLVAA